ncbi:uncharacterized protein [Primulina eburnea]|uniref:uncharacterized protein n=1 Tax=Primulina eburnea TaxID=1245227 RepID=UPI003C6C6C8A
MAISLGVVPNVYAVHTASFVNSSSAASSRLVPANLRAVTVAAASKPATETKKRVPSGLMKPRRISPEMQEFLGGGVTEIPRTLVLKEIWAHIKLYNLQDPADKKVIICDEKLKKIFGGKERIGFLEIAGLINPHFLK